MGACTDPADTMLVKISLQFYDVGDPDPVLVLPVDLGVPEYSHATIDWSGPHARSGLWESILEWTGKLNLFALPAATAAGLLSRYLWDLIESRRRPKEGVQTDPAAPAPSSTAMFPKSSKVKVVVTKNTKRIEFDAGTIDQNTLQHMIDKLLSGKDA